jgi:hypothetical protein
MRSSKAISRGAWLPVAAGSVHCGGEGANGTDLDYGGVGHLVACQAKRCLDPVKERVMRADGVDALKLGPAVRVPDKRIDARPPAPSAGHLSTVY